ncbi:MAG TPA: hypothetical protein VEB42_10220 [Chitinophagaceae bacterium]|nr:hypothetical protein [Chitinophagaceae bacterium]
MERNVKIPVLFVLMEFAPVNTTGNFRSLKFIKYLTRFGVQPIIVTFREEEGAKYFNTHTDPALLNELPPEAIIYRVHCDELKTLVKGKLGDFLSVYFSIKDSLADRWRPYLFKELDAIVNKHKPRLLYTSLPPYSSGMLSVEISRKYNLPLIIDMRDLWALFGQAPIPTYLHFNLMIREERKIFEHATAIIGVTPQEIDSIKTAHPSVNGNKFHLIPNGFDKDVTTLSPFTFEGGKEKIVIGYVGAFYFQPEQRDNVFKPWWKKPGHKMLEYNPVKQDWKYRSPYFFFKALRALFDKYPMCAQKVQVEFVGKRPAWLDPMVAEFGLTGNCLFHGFVDHRTSLELQKRFDLFLATSEKVVNGEHYCMPSKVFDYVGQNKPILGFVTKGIQRDFLRESGLAVICDPDDVAGSVETLHGLFSSGRTFRPNYQYLEQYNRLELTTKLATLIHSLVNQETPLKQPTKIQ